MKKTELIDFLDSFKVFDVRGRVSSSRLKKMPNHIIDNIIKHTNFLHNDPKLSTRIKALYAGVTHHPICPACRQNPVLFKKTKDSFFATACSPQCAMQLESRLQKIRETNTNKYGVPYHQQSPTGKAQRQATNIKKYGHISPAKNPKVREKIKQTNLKKYGHENVFGSEYGKEKIRQRIFEKYERDHYNQRTLSKVALSLLNDKQWLQEQNHTHKYNLQEIAQQLNCSLACVHQHFKKYGISVHRQKQSSFEKQVTKVIQSWSIDCITNSKLDGIEFDIVIPTANIAIECNGIYWHGETKGKDRTYHKHKCDVAENNGYRLIHIFEHDWTFKQHIIVSRLKYLLGQTDCQFYARKCTIKSISSKEANDFFEMNHLQGRGNSSINYALVYDDSIVACLGITLNRFGGDYQYEIVRYSSLIDTTVVGGFNRMFTHFIKEYTPSSVISYADLCWGSGKLYEHAGFKWVGNTSPNYKYFKTNDCLTLYSRHKFQKHKLQDLLEQFNPNLTEWENMINNGYDRIWDCGNAKWVWNSNDIS